LADEFRDQAIESLHLSSFEVGWASLMHRFSENLHAAVIGRSRTISFFEQPEFPTERIRACLFGKGSLYINRSAVGDAVLA
jgi:hypothetical protein